MGFPLELIGNVLLFALVFGMSATVDIKCMKQQIRNRNAILLGLFCQFILLPFLGFAMVNMLQLEAPLGMTLLVVTSSPGGSYSNWCASAGPLPCRPTVVPLFSSLNSYAFVGGALYSMPI